MQADYIRSVQKQFAYYKMLGDKTIAQLDDAQLFWSPDAESNSLAAIVKHLWGNMRSRWTDFYTTDGEKPWRDREAEFVVDFQTRAELLDRWESGWTTLFAIINQLEAADLERIIYIRNLGHSVVEAINRQLAHYAYHVGQMVALGKQLRGAQWQSLSIPRGGSAAYNAQKFAQQKRRQHFTDEFLTDES
ncbi:MAG: DUF1572 family protein [Bacteroidota bacterium]